MDKIWTNNIWTNRICADRITSVVWININIALGQKTFPEIELSGGGVDGKGKDGFEGGTKIPPTKIDIIRPKK